MENDETTQVDSPAEEAFDRDALETSVAESLASLVDSDADPIELIETETAETETETAETETAETETETAETETAETETETAETETAEEASTDESTEEQQSDPKSSTPTFPAAWRRTMRAYDWSDDEITAAMDQGPNERAAFMATAQKLHANRNAEIAKWADMGRRERDAQSDAVTEPVKPTMDSETGKFKGSNIDALIEKYGNEDLVREIAEPFNKMLEEINGIMPDLVSGVASIRESRQQVLSGQIEQFFGSEDLKPYAETYGGDSNSLSEDQEETRNKVLEFADALVAGASLQGRKLSVVEALTLAHDSVSGGFKEKAIRTEIRKSVKKRASGISLKPTGKVAPKAGPKTREDLEKDVRGRLASVFS